MPHDDWRMTFHVTSVISKRMATLITGAGGFIGRHLLAHLADTFPTETFQTLGLTGAAHPRASHVACDMLDEKKVAEAVTRLKPDRVYHLAGSARVTPNIGVPEYFASNYLTTMSLLQALERLGSPVRLFFSSSVHVYGNRDEIVTEETAVRPIGPYAFTKYLAEEAVRHATRRCDRLSAVVGRLYSCIGPTQAEGFVAADLCRKITELPKAGGVLKTGPLSGYRRFLDVRDAVRVFPTLVAAPLGSRFEIFNIASPHELTIGDMVDRLLKLSGKTPRVESAPEGGNPFRGLKLDVGKLQRLFPPSGFRPIESTLRDMLAETAARAGAASAAHPRS